MRRQVVRRHADGDDGLTTENRGLGVIFQNTGDIFNVVAVFGNFEWSVIVWLTSEV